MIFVLGDLLPDYYSQDERLWNVLYCRTASSVLARAIAKLLSQQPKRENIMLMPFSSRRV